MIPAEDLPIGIPTITSYENPGPGLLFKTYMTLTGIGGLCSDCASNLNVVQWEIARVYWLRRTVDVPEEDTADLQIWSLVTVTQKLKARRRMPAQTKKRDIGPTANPYVQVICGQWFRGQPSVICCGRYCRCEDMSILIHWSLAFPGITAYS